MNKDNSSIEKKLSKIKYLSDNKSHLILDENICKTCTSRVCTIVCPAKVYVENDDGTVKTEYENCLECKACKVACPNNAINWNYPKSQKGVLYKFS